MEVYKGHLGKDYKLFTLVYVCARIQTPTTFNPWSYAEGWVDLRAMPDAAVRKNLTPQPGIERRQFDSWLTSSPT